ncbi:MAG: retroviral-like aspartic protease family protein [Candidatus Thiodiazotropha endolucinida]|nr:retroviral-like aspartic protease family protein [Candidatus Thiodiazotropha endolucinida]
MRGTVQGYPLLFTADTGASKTIVSNRVYEAMKPEDRPELMKTSKLVGASGVIIKERGKGLFSLALGPVYIQVEAIVADIDDDGLLGVDVLQNGSEGPADLLMSKGVLMVNKQEVPIIQVGISNRVRRVTAADHFVIPAQSECIIDVYVDREEYDDFTSEREYVIEPTEHFQEQYPLQMASTLVDINRACTCKVRLLNPLPTAMSIKQDAVIGKAEPIDGMPKVVVEEEDKNETKNYVRIRRVDLSRSQNIENSETKIVGKPVEARMEELPTHLREMYKKAAENITDGQKARVAHLLNKFQDSFSRDEWDLGLTHLTEHAIRTGDAPPIKQPPRRVPLAYAEEEKKAIEDLKAKGVIRESVSPWASPIVLVSKKDGGVRPCVDYRKLNELVKPDGFPLPRIQDCLDAVAGSKLFSTLDLTSGYFQIPLKKKTSQRVHSSANMGSLKCYVCRSGSTTRPQVFKEQWKWPCRGCNGPLA